MNNQRNIVAFGTLSLFFVLIFSISIQPQPQEESNLWCGHDLPRHPLPCCFGETVHIQFSFDLQEPDEVARANNYCSLY